MRKKVVAVDHLSVYYGETPAIEGVSLDVYEGEYWGIIGPNGGGKTTLLKSLLGIISPAEGSVKIYGESIAKNRTLLGYVPQVASLNKAFPMTVLEVVLSGRIQPQLQPFFRYSKADKKMAFDLLGKVGIADLAERQISQLSGGEFQRMLIARALAVKPKLLLLDEPTASVDAASRDQIYALLKELNQEMTIILVTHDLLAISSHVGKLACLNTRLVYHGEPELTDEVVNHLYGCPVDLIAHGVPHRVLKQHGEGC
ncbi:metal ABC transporter ATP-binding protein [Acetobacterium woodii]|uniref:Zinc ABC transport system ATP-binding protein ZnuB n=1 Tax=Acetobacterium woodii (strain ATCC 29683 / DSM 1030 / JCM 2381 / KCTC 1655 / WB1) TaxID=931626 RepID=H6LDX6_ACEWD|nr:metal ABC transporter ATP-binding protein [Acetobacterium woodii]AFA48019.1 zinc ABC transport system ATP-binding protein ZnuB [Acetobacterium woodii DSM 1030]